MQDDRTAVYDLPKPHMKNNMADDCNRLRAALDGLDGALDALARKAAAMEAKIVNMRGANASAAGAAGLVPAPAAGAANRYLRSDGSWQVPPDTNTTYGNMRGASASAAGGAGLAPAPPAGAQGKYLRGDGTWQTPPDTNTTYGAATQTANGLMSGADKKKLDGIQTGAQVNPAAGTAAPKAPGTAAVGTSTKYAREDHVHPSNNTDTHWTTHLYVGASNGSANAATTNGNTYLIALDNSTVRDRRLIKGTGDVSVSSDAAGSITITSPVSVPKSGARGQLAGNETAQALSNSQTISVNSSDCINLATSGAVTLTFTAAAATVRALKVLCLTASAATTLAIRGAVWANAGEAPTWGTAGKILVLLAHFVGGRVVLSVADNTQ